MGKGRKGALPLKRGETTNMNTEKNIERFEALMKKVKREGVDKLMEYIRKSDFYSAPTSTRFHLSVRGGLLQHSLNVYDALIASLIENGRDGAYSYVIAGKEVVKIEDESVVVMALLHDLCKTYFYATETRNRKTYDKEKVAKADPWQVKKDNTGELFIWESYEAYTVDDKVPYGHGEKSVMMIEEYMKLKPVERYAIRWHMGYTDVSPMQQYAISEAFKKYPIAWALHNADMQASTFMEEEEDNKDLFLDMQTE